MQKLCMKYDEQFVYKPKNLGFVAQKISFQKTRILRELNGTLARHTGYKLSIQNISDMKGRRKI